VESRQYPVTIHFERQTPTDYLRAALRKVSLIHERLPAGGILVFLSGQREVEQLIQWLRVKYSENEEAGSSKKKHAREKKRKVKKALAAAEDSVAVKDYNEFGVDDVDYEPGEEDVGDFEEVGKFSFTAHS